MTAVATEVRIRKRRIVERPRLFALLDESKARVRMLVAPAGYGKTTLAEQWVVRDGRVGAWYTARSASTDVAALALGIATSATAIVEECDVRLRAHMRALPAPAENVQTLAEILGEDLAAWPPHAWLVVDDYHEIAQEPKAEAFMEALVAVSSIQFLIASRVRPSWVTTKDRLYGDAFEVTQPMLAMDNREAADVLVDRSADSASGLVALANGWPAVIGLAGVSSAEIEDGIDQVPESLYRFFADEVFSALDDDVQQGLTTLAVAPLLDAELAVALLGAEMAKRVCDVALDVGLLVERERRLDLHPLARAFLEEKSGQLGLVPSAAAPEVCLSVYGERREWDAAFDLITRVRLQGELEGLVRLALDDLLDTARLSTLERWCDLAVDVGEDAPIFALARAETALREGRHVEAITHGETAAAGGPELAFRALCVGGRAAHIASREDDALELFIRAEREAASDAQVRDAKWGQLLCVIELERPEAEEAFHAFAAGVRRIDAREVVRAAAGGLNFRIKLGNVDLDDADRASNLLGHVTDPLIVSSFQSVYSAALGLTSRYQEALDVAQSLLETIERYRLDFARPYALCAASVAEAGHRRWASAESHARGAIRLAARGRDAHAHQLSAAQLARVLIQQGRHYEALEIDLPTVREPLPSAHAEVTGTRSLALAGVGRIDDAQQLIGSVRGITGAVEPDVLIKAVDAICALGTHDPSAVERVIELESTAFRRGGLDILVTAYRSSADLLRALLRSAVDKERLTRLVRAARDEDLAEIVGTPVRVLGDRRRLLTPRECQVYDLMVQGLKNREIARALFIEQSTVKAHTHHIYEKLGMHSRTALIVQAKLLGNAQATSATVSSDESSS
jgi:DNA-binding NarL/FixJ family response regulator